MSKLQLRWNDKEETLISTCAFIRRKSNFYFIFKTIFETSLARTFEKSFCSHFLDLFYFHSRTRRESTQPTIRRTSGYRRAARMLRRSISEHDQLLGKKSTRHGRRNVIGRVSSHSLFS